MSGTEQVKKPKKNTWPDERVEVLKTLWMDGLSASQIAARLGDGITRNAVIGKVHRLGLSGRGSPTRVAKPRARRPRQPSAPKKMATGSDAFKPKVSLARVQKREPAPEPIRLVDIPEGERIGILGLTDQTCRWPLGDPGTEDFCFCGHTPQVGTPYCDYHAEIAYQPAGDRRRIRKVAVG